MAHTKNDIFTPPFLSSQGTRDFPRVRRFKRTTYSMKKKSDFDALYRLPSLSSVKSGPFRAFWEKASSEKKGSSFPRLGMVIPKRFTKSTVRRNFLKRVVREHFRKNLPSLPSSDIVISLRKSIHLMIREEIHHHIVALFSLILRKKND